MCKYCEIKGGMIRTQNGKWAYVQGYRFGGNVLVRVAEKYRIMLGTLLTAPIKFCPKCGRSLSE